LMPSGKASFGVRDEKFVSSMVKTHFSYLLPSSFVTDSLVLVMSTTFPCSFLVVSIILVHLFWIKE
jgi:hypothetical protein